MRSLEPSRAMRRVSRTQREAYVVLPVSAHRLVLGASETGEDRDLRRSECGDGRHAGAKLCAIAAQLRLEEVRGDARVVQLDGFDRHADAVRCEGQSARAPNRIGGYLDTPCIVERVDER